MLLTELKIGEKAIILKINGRGAFRKRIMEMGFVKGNIVKSIKAAPLKDPVEYEILNYNLSLRNDEAEHIEILPLSEINDIELNNYEGTFDSESVKKVLKEKSNNINVAFVGNPNCGKTTIFNHASHSKEKVSNYSGVTVKAKQAKFKYKNYNITAIDLPGTYSISSYSPEETYVRDYIIKQQPDLVINVIDGSNLERNLFLTTQLIDMDIKVVIALNMHDEMESRGDFFDHKLFGKLIGIPIIPTVGKRKNGIDDLFDKVIDVYEDDDKISRHIHINYGQEIEKSIRSIQDKMWEFKRNENPSHETSTRFVALRALENDKDLRIIMLPFYGKKEIRIRANEERERLEKSYRSDCETAITDAKYAFIKGALKETYNPKAKINSRRADFAEDVLSHRFWSIPIFFGIMAFIFFCTFVLGEYPAKWIESAVSGLGNLVDGIMADGILKDLIVQGVIGGCGAVLVFLPFIVILYFFISMMEDSGYMARAVFISDRFMHKLGLHGKSFIPLLMGFGCNVPAILATKTIESKRDRIVTMLIIPFMSCSARIPIYVVMISVFYDGSSLVKTLIMFGIYGLGIIIAIFTALLLKKTRFKKQDTPFVMELPPYRIPTTKAVGKQIWENTSQYLKKVGGIVLIAVIIVWALNYFPQKNNDIITYEKQLTELEINKQNKEQIDSLNTLIFISQQENSYIAKFGGFIQPVMKPLGFNEKMTIACIAGIAAKEVAVGTMGVLYSADNEISSDALAAKIRTDKSVTPISGIAFIVFMLIYVPCVSVIAAIKKESGKWKYAIFSIVYSTSFAWILAMLIYQIGSLF